MPSQQNQNQPQTPQLVQDAQVHVANQTQPQPKLSQKLKNFYLKLPKRQKIVLFGGIGLFLIFVLVAVGMMNGSGRILTPGPTPVTTDMPEQTIAENLSKYATDSAVIKIKTDLDKLERDLQVVQIEETTLTPPSLDFDIGF